MVLAFFILALVCPCFAIELSAQSAILYEPSTSTVLFEKNSLSKREIASTTKIMTAVVVLENTDSQNIVTVPSSCVGIEGTSIYLKEGEKLTVSDLLFGMLLHSGNDAATALAYYVGNGNISSFVDMMNETAARIGMKNTNFKNPSGLPDKEHYSTASDMAKLASYAMNIKEFSEIVSTKNKTISGRSLTNHNKLLRIYNGANGLKTGFTKAAGRCLVSGAYRNGMQLIAVTLSAPDDWNDHKRLFDFGFNNFTLFNETLSDAEPLEIPVVGGEFSDISAHITGDVSILTKATETVERIVYVPRFMYAPVYRGDVLGRVEYLINGEVVESASIISLDTVREMKKEGFFKRISEFFKNLFI